LGMQGFEFARISPQFRQKPTKFNQFCQKNYCEGMQLHPKLLRHCLQAQVNLVVVVLPDPFRGMGAWRNSTETQQSGHAPRSGPEVKNGSSAEVNFEQNM